MTEILLNTICNDMNKYLNNYQLEKLKDVLKYNLFILNENNEKGEIDYLDKFFSVKLLEVCSNETIKNYRLVLTRFLNGINKQVKTITTDDIRNYLIEYQLNNNVSKASLDNMRRIISSFFTFLEVEEYIVKNPCRKIKKIKVDKTVKETYSEETLECMREQCKNKRDLAIIDFLSSTGIRVGEMFKLNRDDIKFEDKSCIVFGKESKEREVYFSGKAKVHLKEYLDSRNDNSEALFVSLKYPYNRLSIRSIELIIKTIGDELNIKAHPHKFRRTLATKVIDKGMPIEQVQKLLGHSKLDTTLIYAMVSQNNVRISHGRYIC